MKKLALALLASLVAWSCAAPRIDGSSADRARETIGRVRSSVDESRRKKFDEALTDLMSNGGRALPLLSDPQARARIDGKDAHGVFAADDALRKKIADEQREAKLKNDEASIRSSFASIHSADAPVNVSHIAATDTTRSDTTKTDTTSTTVASNDPAIDQLCGRYADDFQRDECVKEELQAKSKYAAAIPPELDAEVANRLRVSCAKQQPPSYRWRLACVQQDLRMIAVAQKQPAAIAHFPEEVRDEIQWIMTGKR